MKRRNFLQLMAALAGVGFLPKLAAKPALSPQPAIPVGTIQHFTGNNLPVGWLPCDGRVISHNRYPELLEVIGDNYNGSGTLFRVPDLNVALRPVPDDPAHPDLCGWHGEELPESMKIQYIIKVKP